MIVPPLRPVPAVIEVTVPVLEVLLLKTVYEIALNVEIYLSNYERPYDYQLENAIVRNLRRYSTDVAVIGLGLNQQNISVRQHEINHPLYFGKIFDNLEYLGFTHIDVERYGKSYNELYYKKASEVYGVEIDFNIDEIVSKAYVYWNLKLGLHNHEFFKYTLDFGRKYTGLQYNG